MLKRGVLILAPILASFLVACGPSMTATPAPTNPAPAVTVRPVMPVTGNALVQSVEVQIIQNSPLQVNAIASGQLPDSECTAISRARQMLDGNTIRLNLVTVTDSSKVCAQALTPFKYSIALDVNNLPLGKYFVNVNGVKQSFELLPRDLMTFRLSLVEALNARNYELLKVMMSDSFLIVYLPSEATTNTLDSAIEQLRNNLLNTSLPVTADYTRNLIELLGMDPLTIAGPGLLEASSFLVTGLGSAGKDQAILFTAKQPDGGLYWHGLLLAKDGFIKPTSPPPTVDTHAYATEIKYVMALKDVRIRTGPSTQFDIITYIPAGQTARVTGVSVNGDW